MLFISVSIANPSFGALEGVNKKLIGGYVADRAGAYFGLSPKTTDTMANLLNTGVTVGLAAIPVVGPAAAIGYNAAIAGVHAAQGDYAGAASAGVDTVITALTVGTGAPITAAAKSLTGSLVQSAEKPLLETIKGSVVQGTVKPLVDWAEGKATNWAAQKLLTLPLEQAQKVIEKAGEKQKAADKKIEDAKKAEEKAKEDPNPENQAAAEKARKDADEADAKTNKADGNAVQAQKNPDAEKAQDDGVPGLSGNTVTPKTETTPVGDLGVTAVKDEPPADTQTTIVNQPETTQDDVPEGAKTEVTSTVTEETKPETNVSGLGPTHGMTGANEEPGGMPGETTPIGEGNPETKTEETSPGEEPISTTEKSRATTEAKASTEEPTPKSEDPLPAITNEESVPQEGPTPPNVEPAQEPVSPPPPEE